MKKRVTIQEFLLALAQSGTILVSSNNYLNKAAPFFNKRRPSHWPSQLFGSTNTTKRTNIVLQ